MGWAQRTFYPRKDGYRDKNRLVVHTNVPATISVSIAKSGSAGAVKTKKWSKRMSAALVWNGKKGRSFVAPGTYRATITVKGRVGKAKSYSRTVTVSGKQLRGRSFTGSITATNAYVRTLSGSPSGFKDGSMWLWSDGDEYDIVEFGGRLPASFGGYGSTRMYACADSASDPSAAAAVVFADRSGQSTDRGFALSRSAGCTSAAFPTSYIDGRNVRWYAGNVSDYFSYQEIGYFKFTTTIYELR